MLGNNISHLSFSIKHMSVSFDTSYLLSSGNRRRISEPVRGSSINLLIFLPLPCSSCTITRIYKYVN